MRQPTEKRHTAAPVHLETIHSLTLCVSVDVSESTRVYVGGAHARARACVCARERADGPRRVRPARKSGALRTTRDPLPPPGIPRNPPYDCGSCSTGMCSHSVSSSYPVRATAHQAFRSGPPSAVMHARFCCVGFDFKSYQNTKAHQAPREGNRRRPTHPQERTRTFPLSCPSASSLG